MTRLKQKTVLRVRFHAESPIPLAHPSSGGMLKPAIIVIAILAVIVIGAHFADKATRLPKTTAASLTKTESKDESKDEPELTLKDLDGKDVSLASLEGQSCAREFLGDVVRAVQD